VLSEPTLLVVIAVSLDWFAVLLASRPNIGQSAVTPGEG
jgi:hypothetical protein